MRTIKTLIAASLLTTGFMANAATMVGGAVHFKGEIVNAACAVSANSTNQTVEMGQYRSATFKAVGDRSAKVPFTINLQDCDTTVAKTAAVTFNGSTDSTDTTVLATSNIGGGASGSASGVGIEISDNMGIILAPNSSKFSTPQTLNDGVNVLAFTARYKSTSATVSPGKADADATFTMKYE